MQDNDGWGGPSATRSRVGIRDHNWYRISFENSGDGFQTAVDPTDHNIVYSEAQDGRTVRTDLSTGRTVSIRPVAPAPTEPPAAPAPGSCTDGRIAGPGAGLAWPARAALQGVRPAIRGAGRAAASARGRRRSGAGLARAAPRSLLDNLGNPA